MLDVKQATKLANKRNVYNTDIPLIQDSLADALLEVHRMGLTIQALEGQKSGRRKVSVAFRIVRDGNIYKRRNVS